MADIEKVIEAIEYCVFHKIDCVDCYYDGCIFKHGDCRWDMLADALELLKEQEHKDKMFHALEESWKKQPEIVRCKDCKFKGISYSCILDRDLNEYGSHRTEKYDNWFCADGEKATE